MEIQLNIPKYNPEKGFEFNWENNFSIKAEIQNESVKISANKEGLLSLANHLLNLAQEEIASGHHFHLDEFNSLEEGSIDLIFEKI